jgi:hypothetical protein
VEGQRQSYPLHAPGTGLGLTLTPSAPSASTSSAGGTYVPGSVSSPTFAFPPTPGSETEADAQFMDVDNEPKRPPTRRARFCTSGKWFAGQM